MKKGTELDVTKLEKRERHLWIATLFLLFVFAAATVVTFSSLVDSSSLPGGFRGSLRLPAFVGLVVLTALFGAYATRAEAAAAAAELPAQLIESQPWIRRIGDLQAAAIR